MTWQWLTSSRRAAARLGWVLLAGWLSAMCLRGAVLSGSVTLANSRQDAVRKKRDFSGVVIWLEPVGRRAVFPPPKTYRMIQKGKRFHPHVLAIPVGSTVDLPNLDPIFHNAFSNFAGQPFDTGLYRPGTSQKVQFRRDGVVRVFCNIHSSMSAVIVVLKTPYSAVTGLDGKYVIPNLEPGEYRMHVWHERAAEATLAKLEKLVRVEAAGLTCAPIEISESGFVEVPHKNKFDREYGPEPTDSLYPGGRK